MTLANSRSPRVDSGIDRKNPHSQFAGPEKDGPVVFVTAALHGDEINGTGAVRQQLMIKIPDFKFTLCGALVILVPVLNLAGISTDTRAICPIDVT